MRQTFLPLLAVLACQTALAASDGQKQADDFTKLYSSTCFAYLPELDKLTEKLADFPPVPEEDAQNFLMPEHEHCALYAYHADAARVEKQYLDFVKKPPEGFTAELYEDTHDTIDGIKTHTITYQWKASDSEDKPTFMLTTSTDPQSSIQAMISVAILAKD